MFCSNCGRKISERDKVCPYCGSTVEEEFCNGFCRITEQTGEEITPSVRKKQRVSDQHVYPGDAARGKGGVSEIHGKGNKEKEQFPVQILVGIIGLLLFLLIIQSIRLGIAGHEGTELRKKNAELEKAQVELIRKNEELQQLLSQSESLIGNEQDVPGQTESYYDQEEVSDHAENSEDDGSDTQSSMDSDLQQNEESDEELSSDSEDSNDAYTGGVYEE